MAEFYDNNSRMVQYYEIRIILNINNSNKENNMIISIGAFLGNTTYYVQI